VRFTLCAAACGRFEEFLRHAKANPLAAKTIQMYRWMTGSVFRKIDAAVPGMSNEELKVRVPEGALHQGAPFFQSWGSANSHVDSRARGN
jgi:hypothetical protein